MIERISPAAFELIVRYETGGQEYYDTVYKSRPCWPGGSSGVTIGCGFDIGYEGAMKLRAYWQDRLDPEAISRLARCEGKTGRVARQALSGVRDIPVLWKHALEVFNESTLPNEIRKTLNTFPKAADKLSRNAFGALVSLVFNRGEGIDTSDRRREMRNIRNLVMSTMNGRELHECVSREFMDMRRLWTDDPKSDQDLVDRRTDEAKLVLLDA